MKKLSALVVFGVLSCSFVSNADQVCGGYNSDGTCNVWLDTSDNSMKHNDPSVPSNPSNPGSSCVCNAYNQNGACIGYSCK